MALHVGGDVTIGGLILLVAAAASWGGGNIVSKRISARASTPERARAGGVGKPVCAAAARSRWRWCSSGRPSLASFAGLDWVSAGPIAYIVYLSTLFCFAAWSRLLGLYPVSTVAPFTLLVPVFGFLGSAVLLGEPCKAGSSPPPAW